MRKWHKYWLDSRQRGTHVLRIDHSATDHEQTMGGYGVDEAYRDKEAFFRAYFFGYHLGRLEYYEAFLRTHLRKEDEVLSLGSGRGACELRFIDDGYRITCSDLRVWEAAEAAKALFGQLRYIPLDILQGPSTTRYDAVLCLGLSYVFDHQALRTCFEHIAQSLRPGGRMILEVSGLPDSLMGSLVDDVLLHWETLSARMVRWAVRGQLDGVVVKHHGYRWKEREIVGAASAAGLILRHRQRYGPAMALWKSRLFNKLAAAQPRLAQMAAAMVRWPYIRMYMFEHVR